MKCQVAFVFAVATMALVFADESPKERVKRIHSECQSDPATEVKESVLEEAGKGNVDVKAIGPHTLCMNVKFGMQKPNGDIDEDELREAVKKLADYDTATIEKVVTECGKRDGATAHDAAVALFQCYAKHTEKGHGDH